MVPVQPPPPTELCPALKPPAAASRAGAAREHEVYPKAGKKRGSHY